MSRCTPQEVISALAEAARLEGRFARKPANDAETAPSFVGAVLVLSAAYGVPVPEGQGIEPKRHIVGLMRDFHNSRHTARAVEPGGEEADGLAPSCGGDREEVAGWRLWAQWERAARVTCVVCGARTSSTMSAFRRGKIKQCATCAARAEHARSVTL